MLIWPRLADMPLFFCSKLLLALVLSFAVVNGRLTNAGLDAAPANELRLVPNWLDESLDPLRQHTW